MTPLPINPEPVAFFEYLLEHRASRGLAESLLDVFSLRTRVELAALLVDDDSHPHQVAS